MRRETVFEGQTDPSKSLDDLANEIEKESKSKLRCSEKSDPVYVRIIQGTGSACKCSDSHSKQDQCSCPKLMTKMTAADEVSIEQTLENETKALDLTGHGKNVLFILEGDVSSKGWFRFTEGRKDICSF